MTSLVDEIRTDIEVEIFDVLGKTITLIKKTTPIYNNRGELIDYTSTETTVVGVPYNIVWDRHSPQPFGQMSEGDMALFVKYNVDVKKDDLIVMDGDTFKVSELNYHFLPENVATLLRITRVPELAAVEVE